jgi:Ca-activated chloride channel homolog
MRKSASVRFPVRPVAVVAAILLSSFGLEATRPRPSRASPQISVQVDVVTVPVTVTDRKGNFVSGLERRNFRLLVDGAERPVEYFAPEVEPAQLLLLVETGPAVFLLRHEHIAAAVALLEGLGPGDRVAVASYSDIPRLIAGFTADKQQAADALGSINYSLGMAQLNFYDSLAGAVEGIGSGGGKRSIVVLTTGLDGSGPGHWQHLVETLRRSNVMILPVALGGELRDARPRSRKKRGAAQDASGLSFAASDRALNAIAAETGGHAFFPRSERDYEQAYRKIAALLRHEYSVGFEARERDGRYHSITVELVNDHGQPFDGKDDRPLYRWNARRGFLAPHP